jgi:O-antigen ligase
MRKTTKDDIFTMLVLILSAATSVLIGWAFCHFGNAEVDDFKVGPNLLPFFVWMVIAFKPWAYLLDFVFRLFEKKNH